MTTATEWAAILSKHADVPMGRVLSTDDCRQLATLLRAMVAEREARDALDADFTDRNDDAYRLATLARRWAEGE